MSLNWKTRVALGKRGPRVTRLGLGGAPLGGLYQGVPETEALATLRQAHQTGFNLFDTAPYYGSGRSELRFGSVLRGVPRESFVISTKVGRVLEPAASKAMSESDYKDALPFTPVFDFSRGAILKSHEQSLSRLGLERVDILLLHDPDDHWRQALDEAYPALDELRSGGHVQAIGVGMNQTDMLLRFAQQADFDCFLLAGRYTLLDQQAIEALLPICQRKGIAIMAGGVFNSGILATGGVAGAMFDYRPASPEMLARTQRLEAVCQRHHIPLQAAALQFPLAHPAVASVLVGPRSPKELQEILHWIETPIPPGFWMELKQAGLIHAECPIPG